jgi:hypothetical protein
MTETIIFLCGVLSGLVALLLGYFIRMGLLHNKEIRNLKVDVDSAFKVIEENREQWLIDLKEIEGRFEKDIENLHNSISILHKEIEESNSYTDKRVDKVIDKFNIYLNKKA